MDIETIISDIVSEEEQLNQRKQDAARELRSRATELRTECEKALAEAAELEAQADKLDPPEIRKAVKKGKLHVSTEGVEFVEDPPAKRGRKPSASKAKAASGSDPTPEGVLAAVPQKGADPISSADIAATLDADVSKVRVILRELVAQKLVKQVGVKRGAKYVGKSA
jgi:hypothetical protein